MMKKSVIMAMICLPIWGMSQLKVSVSNIEKIEGNLMIVLLVGDDQEVQKLKIPVTEKDMIISFKKELPKGDYSIKIYQDVNKNGELDKSFWGIPEEPYGFSNNPKGESGSRDFDESKFYYDGISKTEKVILVH